VSPSTGMDDTEKWKFLILLDSNSDISVLEPSDCATAALMSCNRVTKSSKTMPSYLGTNILHSIKINDNGMSGLFRVYSSKQWIGMPLALVALWQNQNSFRHFNLYFVNNFCLCQNAGSQITSLFYEVSISRVTDGLRFQFVIVPN
jgi:hypothetical protein